MKSLFGFALFFVCFLLNQDKADAQCTDWTVPDNGQIDTTDVAHTTVVTLTCNNGEAVTGASTSTCETDTWNPTSFGTCTSDCPSLPAPSCGSLSTAAVVTGTTVELTCTEGTADPSSTTCTNGEWSAELGNCTCPNCPALTAPTCGALSTDAVTPGTTVKLNCTGGCSTVTGEESTTCTNGVWSPTLGTCDSTADGPGEDGGAIPTLNKLLIMNVIVVMLGFIYI
ncbi:uncharacterized protein LOC144440242 [Glandiceps talaboti]